MPGMRPDRLTRYGNRLLRTVKVEQLTAFVNGGIPF
jgi:hypothetical protein